MHPILFEIPAMTLGSWVLGPFPIRMYGLMIGIGFLLFVYLASRRGRKEGVDPDRIVDLGVYLLLSAIIGSRILYVLTNIPEFAARPLDVFAIWKGGLVFYGPYRLRGERGHAPAQAQHCRARQGPVHCVQFVRQSEQGCQAPEPDHVPHSGGLQGTRLLRSESWSVSTRKLRGTRRLHIGTQPA